MQRLMLLVAKNPVLPVNVKSPLIFWLEDWRTKVPRRRCFSCLYEPVCEPYRFDDCRRRLLKIHWFCCRLLRLKFSYKAWAFSLRISVKRLVLIQFFLPFKSQASLSFGFLLLVLSHLSTEMIYLFLL